MAVVESPYALVRAEVSTTEAALHPITSSDTPNDRDHRNQAKDYWAIENRYRGLGFVVSVHKPLDCPR